MLRFIHKPKNIIVGTGDYVFRHYGPEITTELLNNTKKITKKVKKVKKGVKK